MKPPVATPRAWLQLASVGLAILLTGCALPSTPSVTPTAPITRCFAGPGEITLPGQSRLPSHRLVAQRTLQPDAGRVIETVAHFDLDDSQPPTLYQRTLKVDGDHFTFRSTDGTFEGDGRLDGPPWAWTRWRSTTRMRDGATVESEDQLEGDALHVVKRGLTANGAILWTIHESLNTSPLNHCADAFAPLKAARPDPSGGSPPP